MVSAREHDEGRSERGDFALGGTAAFRLFATASLAAIALFHIVAISGMQGPFLADSVEYLMMAREIVGDEGLPLKPVRSALFPLLLAGPMALERYLSGSFGVGSSLVVLLAFASLALAGTYRLGELLGGRWAGLVAALLLGLLPEFTYWSVDTLTDVPAAACIVWAVVFWIRRRPVAVGLALGTVVALRYQSLIPFGAFLLVPVVQRRWRDLGLVLLGTLPPLAALGALDWAYWGTPFHTLRIFVPRQLSTFLPLELVQRLLPVDAVLQMKPSGNSALAIRAAKSPTWYLEQAPSLFTWPVLAAMFLAPFVVPVSVRRPGRALTAWILLVSLGVLSVQSFKETRYLCGIAPLVAALAGLGFAGGLWRLRANVPGRVVLLALLGLAYARTCWKQQAALPFRPFGSALEAVETIPAEARPCSVAMPQPWILTQGYPIRVSTAWHWYAQDLFVLDLVRLRGFFELPPEVQATTRGHDTMDAIDYYLIHGASRLTDPAHFRWLNERTVFDGYFYTPRANRRAVIRLRRSEDPEREPPFWQVGDARARTGAALGLFRSQEPDLEVELVGVESARLAPSASALRVDSLWRIVAEPGRRADAEFRVVDADGALIALDRAELLPDDPFSRRSRSGDGFRLRRYLRLERSAPSDPLTVQVRVATNPGGPQAGGHLSLEVSGPNAVPALPGEHAAQAHVKVLVPVAAYEAPSLPVPAVALTPDG